MQRGDPYAFIHPAKILLWTILKSPFLGFYQVTVTMVH